ncbi:TetR/AcrR family transcriptional regulator [Nocardioides sp. 1609]|uniref:TetR/AcrR family transcriptional regulator n=1 Tax=Nocardioides sp. 1609 TaxID=2508327 RepID=UPI0010702718|nr:TetR/AcrR family transcriptional regulator [Nocardioides sp. 1609]
MPKTKSNRMGVAVSAEQQERRETGPLTGRGHARRAALLDAARRVFEERGFLETRVADIAAEAKVAQGTFYTYFDSKDAIFQAVAARVAGDMIVELGSNRPLAAATYERTYAATQRFVDSYRRNAKILALIEQVGTFTPEMKRIRLQVREAHVDRLAQAIAHQQEIGLADDSLDPALTAELVGSMVDQVCHVWLNLGHEFDEAELVHALTVLWLRGAGMKEIVVPPRSG